MIWYRGDLITMQSVHFLCILEPCNFNEEVLSMRWLLLQFDLSQLSKFAQQLWMFPPALDRCLLLAGLCIFTTVSPGRFMWKYFCSHRYFGNQYFFTQVCLYVRQRVHMNYADWLSSAIKFYWFLREHKLNHRRILTTVPAHIYCWTCWDCRSRKVQKDR